MVKKYFYLINYIIDISLFRFYAKHLAFIPKGYMLVLHVDTPERDNLLQKKKKDISVRGYIALSPFLALILSQQLTQSLS